MEPYSDGMPGRRTIGVDMGGTKLLAGAVDSELSVHHRVQRSMNRLDQSYLLDAVVEAVEETSEGAGGQVDAVGFGIPSLIDQRSGTAVVAVNLPLKVSKWSGAVDACPSSHNACAEAKVACPQSFTSTFGVNQRRR